MNTNRFLNMGYAVEVINGRLNGSAEQVEQKKSEYGNTTYVKKIGNRGVVSAVCQKHNIQDFVVNEGMDKSTRVKIGNKVSSSADPYKFFNEDIFGYMRAESVEINDEDYQLLTIEEQSLFEKNGKKGWKQNITKKRKSRFLMSPLVNVGSSRINSEWNICSTKTESMPYIMETYSGIFSGISNIDIANISKFTISDVTSEFRDYAPEEGIKEEDIIISREDKLSRIEAVLRGFQLLSIKGNQNNYLTDTRPKFIILGEYDWGNNAFSGIIKKDGLDIESLKEILDGYLNEKHRTSPIWIGVNKNIENESYKGLKEKLVEELKDYDYVNIGTVDNAFGGYLEYLKETL